jgi:hypothetical protein
MSWPVGLSCRTYRILMGAFPRHFRDRFGPEIGDTFDHLATDAWRDAGARGLGRLWIQTLADLGRHGGGERIGNGKLTAPPPPRPLHGRRAGAFDTLIQDL